MDNPSIGFVGFGAVGNIFSKVMIDHGARVYYHDVRGETAGYAGPVYLPLPELIETCDPIISTVVTNVALDAAQQVATYLRPGKTFADFNSTSPSVKVKVSDIVTRTGANFVEGAILSPVGPAREKSVILVCGPAAEAFAAQMVALGLQNVRYLSPQYGEASMAKMLRSVFAKGVECLLLEMMSAAQRAGIEQYLWNDIMQFMHETPFQKLAENWIKTHPEACDRRWHEMTQVVQTLEELGVDPFMSRASEAFFARTAESHPAESFPQPPTEAGQVFRYLNETLWPSDGPKG